MVISLDDLLAFFVAVHLLAAVVVFFRREAPMSLEKELETYRQRLPELKAEEGKFVLIHGEEVVGTYTSYEDAIKAGYLKYGVTSTFLVKQIQAIEQVHLITRLIYF